MMWGYGYLWWPNMLLMFFTMLLWIAVLGVGVWALLRWARRAQSSTPPAAAPPRYPQDSAMEILRGRYARGEINTSQFEELRAGLEEASEPSITKEQVPTHP